MNILCEGLDRSCKSTNIEQIQQEFGYFLTIHYQKPKTLSVYKQSPWGQLENYQRHSFLHLMHLLDNDRILCDRAHLGEAVYAKRYRGYDGDYVFALEKEMSEIALKQTKLILFTTSDHTCVVDDGLSFDHTKREEEQQDFIAAFHRSIIPQKHLIDVCKPEGGYREKDDIWKEIKQFLVL